MRPAWLGGLLEESFFDPCMAHESRRKNEKNMFCLRCCFSLCTHCAPSHNSHPLIQVRRYVYNDVVRTADLEKLIDCSYIQPYTINSAKVMFLKQRPLSRAFKGAGNACLTCDRMLQEPFHFCCISCKVEHVIGQGRSVGSVVSLPDLETLGGGDTHAGVDCGCTDADDDDEESGGSSSASSGERGRRPKGRRSSAMLPAQMVRLSLQAAAAAPGNGNSRRKGAPHRSPLS